MSVRLTILPNPFTTERVERQVDPAPIVDYLQFSPLRPETDVIKIVNDTIVGPDTVPSDGDHVILRAVPAGGGGVEGMENKGDRLQRFGRRFFAATILFLPPVALVVGGLTFAWGSLLKWGASVVSDLVESLLPGDRPAFREAPGVRGSRNSASPGAIIPMVFGRRYLVPPFAAQPFARFEGNDQYLYQYFVAGYSPLVLSDFRIAETAVTSFDDPGTPAPGDAVFFRVQEGLQAAEFYTKQVVTENVGVQLKNANGVTSRTTIADIDSIEIDLTAPRGIVRFNDDNDPVWHSVSIQILVYVLGAPDAPFRVVNQSLGGRELRPIRRTVRIPVDRAEAVAYEIRVLKTSPDTSDTSKIEDVGWDSFRAFRNDPPLSPYAQSIVTRVDMRVVATNQLNGVIDRFNCIAQSQYADYTGSGSGPAAWTVRTTRNPASAFLRALQGPHMEDPVPDQQIDWQSLEIWHTWCADPERQFECNAILERGMPLERLLNNICSTGRASWSVQDGKYRVILDAPRPFVSQLITPRNSWDISGTKTYVKVPHGLRVSFVNEEVGYQQDELIVYAQGYDASNAIEFQSIDLWGITKPAQAQKQGQYLLAVMTLRPETYTVSMDVEHLISQRGDAVNFQFPDGLIGTQTGRIVDVTEDQTRVVQIVLDEIVPIDPTSTYTARIRSADGMVHFVELVTPPADSTIFELSGNLASGSVAADDLCSVGIAALETVQCLISEIEVRDDLSAQLTLVVDDPGVYTADQVSVPPFQSSITPPQDLVTTPQLPRIETIWSDDSAAIRNPDGTVQARVLAAIVVESQLPLDALIVQLAIQDDIGEPGPWRVQQLAPIGQTVAWDDLTPGSTVTLRARLRSSDNITGPWVEATHTVTGPDFSSLPNVIADRPTFAELDQGWESPGGTTTPRQIVLLAVPYLRTIGLRWDRQVDLTNLDRYELQVTDDAAALSDPTAVTWYALADDGANWAGAADGVTPAYSSTYMHQRVPHAGTAAEPLGRTLYYRARQVTKAGAPSPWSAPVSATTRPADAADLAADSITAEKLAAQSVTAEKLAVTVLQALFANITDQVTVGGEGLLGETADRLARSIVRAGQFEIQTRRTASDDEPWVTQAKMGIESNTARSALLRGHGVLSPETAIDSFDLGIRPPEGARVFRFTNQFVDLDGADPFAVKTNLAFDIANTAFGTHALVHSGGEGVLTWPAAVNMTNDWTIQSWLYSATPASEIARRAVVTLTFADDTGGDQNGRAVGYERVTVEHSLDTPVAYKESVAVQMRGPLQDFSIAQVSDVPATPYSGILPAGFSPDGSLAVYVQFANDGVDDITDAVIFDTSSWTETARFSLAGARGFGLPAFSPDSTLLAFVFYVNNNSGNQLFVFDTASMTPRTVSFVPPGTWFTKSMAWTPDGSQLAIASTLGLFVLDATNDFAELYSDLSATSALGPATTATTLLYADRSAETIVELSLADYTETAVVAVPGMSNFQRALFSPDATQLVLSGQLPATGLLHFWVVDVATGTVVADPTPPTAQTSLTAAQWVAGGAFVFLYDNQSSFLYRSSDWSLIGSQTINFFWYAPNGRTALLRNPTNPGPILVYDVGTLPLVAGYDHVRVVDYAADDSGAQIAAKVAANLSTDQLVESAVANGNQVTIANSYPGQVAAREVDVALATVTVDQAGANPNYAPPAIVQVGSDVVLTHYHTTASPAIALWISGAFVGVEPITESGWSLWHLSHDVANGLLFGVNDRSLAVAPHSQTGTQDVTLRLEVARDVHVDDLFLWVTARLSSDELATYYASGLPWSPAIDYQKDLLLASDSDGRIVLGSNVVGQNLLPIVGGTPPPVGATYIQFPGMTDPSTLWPLTDWVQVLNDDPQGLFFRTEGAHANPFEGDVQEHGIPNINGRFNPGQNASWISPSGVFTRSGNAGLQEEQGQSGGGWVYFNSNRQIPGTSEVRPRNVTIRVWRRDA